MARTGKQENQEANKQYSAIEADQIRRANLATDSFNNLLAKVMKGETDAIKDPYKDEGYLQNQNILAAGAASSANKAAAEQLNTEALRTGSNTASRAATIRDLGRQKMRAMTDYQAGRAAED